MTTMLTQSRIVPAAIWGWTAIQLSALAAIFPIGPVALVPPIVAMIAGATVARRATGYVLALAFGLMMASVASWLMSLFGVGFWTLPVYVVVAGLVTFMTLQHEGLGPVLVEARNPRK